MHPQLLKDCLAHCRGSNEGVKEGYKGMLKNMSFLFRERLGQGANESREEGTVKSFFNSPPESPLSPDTGMLQVVLLVIYIF